MAEPAKTVVAEGKFLRMVRKGHWEYVERVNVTGIVGLVPITDDGKIVLVEQYRPPVCAAVVELPAGLVGDVPGQETEALAAGARRELLEETGYAAGELRAVAMGAASAGSTSEIMTFFLATGLRKISAGGGDGGEDIIVHEVPLSAAPAWLAAKAAAGAVIDLKVYAGLYFANTKRRERD